MKKQLTYAAMAVLLMFGVASAQTTFDLGVKGGGGFFKMSGDPDFFLLLQSKYSSFADSTVETDTDGRSGFHGGAFLTINLNGPVSIQPEIIYSTKGVKELFEYTYSGQDYKTSLSIVLTYVEIPVLVKYNFQTSGKIKPRLYAGPALAFNVDGKFKGGSESNVASELKLGEVDITNAKSTEFSGIIGGELGLEAGKVEFLLDVRFTQGFTQAFEDATYDPSSIFDRNEYAFVNSSGVADDMKNSGFSIDVGVSFPIGGGGAATGTGQ